MANTLKFGTDGNWAVKNGSALAYNSENGNFKPLPFTFDRSTSATRVNKQGLIEVVSNNEPRIDFLNDSKGALLLEPARTNLITQSNDFDTQSKSNVTVTSDAIISPDGTLNADKLVENSSNSSHYLRINTSTVNPSVISVFAKKGEETKIFIGNANFSQGVLFDLDLGVIESGSDGTIENYGNGWYKCSFYRTDLSAWQYISLRGNFTTYQGNGVNGVYLYGLQLEQGSYATSYIPTQGSIGTRDAETSSQTPPSGIIGQTEGTVFLDVDINTLSTDGQVLRLTNGTSGTGRIAIERDVSNQNQLRITQWGGSTLYFPISVGNRYKIAVGYDSSNSNVYVNGLSIGTSFFTNVAELNKVSLGCDELGGSIFNDTIKEVKLYNTRLLNTELEALTKI